jgi:hypothetical protein
MGYSTVGREFLTNIKMGLIDSKCLGTKSQGRRAKVLGA